MKYFKTINELYDDENLRDSDEIRFLSKNIDKKEMSKATIFYLNKINDLILSKLPFYKNGKPTVFVDYIKYRFGDNKDELIIIIERETKDFFVLHLYYKSYGKCLNPQDKGEVYDTTELINNLESLIPAIENEFNVSGGINSTLN